MTTLALSPAEDRLRTVLLVDSVIVTSCGVLLAVTPSSWYGSAPPELSHLAGAVGALLAAEVALFSRWHGRRLRLAALVTAVAAFAWTLLSVLAVEAYDVRGAGLEVLALGGLATLVFGTLEMSLVRALR